MLHVLTLFSVLEETAVTFTDSIRRGGYWHIHACRFSPDLIATDLLEHLESSRPFLVKSSSHLYITIDFWSSHEAYFRAERSPEFQALLLARRRMATSAFELGAFDLPTVIQSREFSERPTRF